MKKILKKYYSIIILLIFLTFFFKLILNSYDFYNHRAAKKTQKFIAADQQQIKVYPKISNEYIKNGDKELYNFVSKKNWKLESKSAPQKEQKIISKHKFQDKKSKNKPLINDVINFENHTIRIIDKKKSNKPTFNHKNTVQLGAYATIDKAEKEKYRVINLYKEHAKRNHFYIEKVFIKGKGIIYRLKVGPFANSNIAKNFCHNLRKKGIECFMTIN